MLQPLGFLLAQRLTALRRCLLVQRLTALQGCLLAQRLTALLPVREQCLLTL
ncbi:MAG: hypothetical protein JNM84_22265 [Planctomycetes bacterium]|nr:hypothetical protein [Planctomycetota bacterium]